MNHPDDATIEQFAIGAFESDAFIEHVASCDACSAKLQREARLELALLEVREAERTGIADAVPSVPPKRTSSWAKRPAFVTAGLTLLAAAAALFIYVKRPNHDASAERALKVVNCPDGSRQLRCIADANREGSYIEYPRDPRLLRFGATPGFTAVVDPSLDDARESIERCLEQHITAREPHVRILVFAAVVEEDGRVIAPVEPRSAVYREMNSSGAFLMCMDRAMKHAKFVPNGHRTMVEQHLSYIWRE
jgi:hypothetical protein